MSYPINYPTPQGANIQIFKEGGTTSNWVKPQGASFVWFTLIGAGGSGGYGTATVGAGGGGSGAVTNFMGPAFFMPDVLQIYVAKSDNQEVPQLHTNVTYQQKDGTGYLLLNANGGGNVAGSSTAGLGGSAMSENYFTAMGFFQSIAGQSGSGGGSTTSGTNLNASTTTFLSGGAGGSGAVAGTGGSVTPNYGYTPLPPTPASELSTIRGANGYFQMQPIIVGCGGAGGTTNEAGYASRGGLAGIGCGSGGAGEDSGSLARVKGGDGMVVIITW